MAEACNHKRGGYRGSSAKTHRVFCFGCQECLYECPQTEWKQKQQNMKDEALRGRTERFDISRSGEKITREELREVQSLFPQAIKLHLRQHSAEEFEMTDVERLLQDVVDTVRDKKPEDAKSNPPR